MRQDTCAGDAVAEGHVQLGRLDVHIPLQNLLRGRIFNRQDVHRDSTVQHTAKGKETEIKIQQCSFSETQLECSTSSHMQLSTCSQGQQASTFRRSVANVHQA